MREREESVQGKGVSDFLGVRERRETRTNERVGEREKGEVLVTWMRITTCARGMW